MLQSEFETRVQMPVSAKEYAAIEEVYYNSDLQKDEFCKVWAKMNASRIKAHKEQQAQLAKEERNRNKLVKLYNKLEQEPYEKKLVVASLYFTDTECSLLMSNGFMADRWLNKNEFGGIILATDISFALGKHLGFIK